MRVDPEAAARMLEMYFDDTTPLALANITIPTLLLRGSHDAIVPVAVAEMASAASRTANW